MNAEIDIRRFDPSEASSAADVSAIRELVVQPAHPWFSAVELRHFEGALSGEFAGVACDRFWIAWRGREPVAHVCFSTAVGAPEAGLLAFVITAPAYRGRGLGTRLLRATMADFGALGGRCMQLATANPAARRVYESCGFRDYAGHIMRWLACPDAWANFDRDYFAHGGPTRVRAAHWGDSARIVMLYTAPHPWFVRDYPERLYNHPAFEQTRCASILPALMAATGADAPGGRLPRGFWVLENPAGRIVGSATLRTLDVTAQAHAPVLDFLVAPAYFGEAGRLVGAAVDAARARGAGLVRTCMAGCDAEKADLLAAAGFRREATLPGQFAAGPDCFDLHVYTLDLS